MQTFREHQSQPPRHVYTAVVTNNFTEPIKLKVTYQVPPTGTFEDFEVASIPVGGSAEVPQKLVNMGTYTATGHIFTLEVLSESGHQAVVNAPYMVWSPTKDYPFLVVPHEKENIWIEQPRGDHTAK